MKSLLTLLTVCGFCLTLSAQRSTYYFDYIYLRDADSTVIAGWLLEQVPGEYVKIELPGGSVMVIEQSKIERMTVERSPYKSVYRQSNIGQKPYFYRNRGFQQAVSVAFAVPEGEWGDPVLNPSLYYRVGYQWHRYLGTNIGSGLDFLHAGLVIPLYAEFTGYLQDRPKTPFYSLRAGYGFAVTPLSWLVTEVNGGPMAQAMFGLMWHTRSRQQLQFSVGYKFQELIVSRNGGWDWRTGEPLPGITLTRAYQGLTLAFGVRI